jgi:hypothetical protein
VAKIGRNQPCPCGSGKKYKRCCGSSSNSLSPKGIRIKLPIPAERVHAAVIDHERERAIFVSNDIVTTTLCRGECPVLRGKVAALA